MGSEQIYLYDLYNAQEPVVRCCQFFETKEKANHVRKQCFDLLFFIQYFELPAFDKPDDFDEKPDNMTKEMPSTSTSTPATCTKVSKLPPHVNDMKRCGNDFMENEKYLQAINQYSDCIELLPDHPVFYLNRATAYMRRNWFGDMYSGLRDCQKALKLDPTYVKAHFRLARVLFEMHYVTEAIECLDELKRRFPHDAKNRQIQLLYEEIADYIKVLKIILSYSFDR